MKTIRYLVLFFLQVIYCYANCQKENINFEHLDVNSGLCHNRIICTLQDRQGFMWFGTGVGLNKYDGYKFTVYKNDPKDSNSLSNNFISGILEDSKGVIWISTRGGGLNRYDKERNKFTRYKNNPATLNSISSDLTTGLIQDNKGNLWIGAENGGLNYFEPDKNKFSHYMHNDNTSLSEDNARCIFEDKEHNIWVGNYSGGLNLFNSKTKTFTHFRHNDKDSTSLGNDNVAVIFEDSKRRLWIGTVGGGLNLLDKNTGKFHRYMHVPNSNSISGNVVFALCEDDDGNLWIGTENGGLNIYNPTTNKFRNFLHDEIDNKSLSNNSVYSIYKDMQGTMWVGTFAGGLNIFNKDANKFAHYKHNSSPASLNNNYVLCMLEDKEGKILIGTDGGGLNIFDPVTKDFKHLMHEEGNNKSICGNYVLSVCEDSKGNLWIGTWADGITVYNPKKNTFEHFKNDPLNPSSLSNNNAWNIFEDHDKNIWVGTYSGGLNLYNPTSHSFIRFDDSTGNTSTKKIYSITEDINENLWIGTDGGGIEIFNKKNKTFTGIKHDNTRNSLSNDQVMYIYPTHDGNFWINTTMGLNFYDPKKNQFTIYTTADGLPDNVIFGLLEDAKGNLWLSTNKGLSYFDPVTKKFKNFGIEDGLQSSEFKMRAFCKTHSGTMYFGGINGFNEFFPNSITRSFFDPPLVLTDFQLFNKKVFIAKDSNDPSPIKKDISVTKEIVLSYKQSVISFEFASLNYTAQSKKQYQYRLEGFDKDWNEIGTNRTATYTNLDPAKYIFKVRGLNNQGNWSSKTIAVELTITPPFWSTWWFRLTLFIIICGSVFAFFRWRINAVENQKAKLQKQVQEQTLQLVQSAQEEQKARQQAEQANKDLERKNIELEQFAYIASHDLQEPLRTTSSFVALLQKQYQGRFDEKADKYFTFISDASERMKVLIKNLLDYSRIGNKKELEEIDCNKTLNEVLADLGTSISEANANIQYTPLPVINGYPTEMKQLFQNLITNGMKFRKKGTTPEIKISAQRIKDSWQFAFQDNGIGIDPKHNEKIFVIFQRLHTRNDYEGSGIGLSHCKKIVELHKGKIWVDSKVGQGSTFYFTIYDNNKAEIIMQNNNIAINNKQSNVTRNRLFKSINKI